jgi:two-component system nitrate/nitrite response regulator NarL
MQGAPNKLIGSQLAITEATVKVHIKAMLRRLKLHNRTQAAMWASDHLATASKSKD